jgi:CubicO group peptidase (beta-lactamase class C family)
MGRKLYSLVFCLIFLGASPCFPKDITGYWHGLADCYGKRHIVLVVEKLVDGTFAAHYDSIESGEFGISLKNITVSDKAFHGEFETSGVLDLKMDGEVLKGTIKLPEYAIALFSGHTFPLSLNRGMDYSVPRLNREGKGTTDYAYQVPVPLGDGWETGSLQEAGGDRKKIEELVKSILDMSSPYIHSLLLVRHGKLVLDEYFYGYGPQETHQLQSTTKSVLSILFGIAEGQGLVKTDQKLSRFFPDWRGKPGWDARKGRITLGTLLSMTSGFACDDGVYRKGGGSGCTVDMINTTNWVDYGLTQPMAHEPGRHYSYCTSCLTLLGAVLAKQSGMSIPDFAQKYLYDPLGIQGGDWLTGPDGTTEVGASHWLRPRDMAKLGLLVLDKGQWKGKQIVPADWVEKSTRPQPLYADGKPWETFSGYGYLWWTRTMATPHGEISVFYANGKGGQYIIVAPDLDLVCAMTAGYYGNLNSDLGLQLFKEYVLNAFN